MNEAPASSLRDKVFGDRLVKVDETAHVAPLAEAMDLTGTPARLP